MPVDSECGGATCNLEASPEHPGNLARAGDLGARSHMQGRR